MTSGINNAETEGYKCGIYFLVKITFKDGYSFTYPLYYLPEICEVENIEWERINSAPSEDDMYDTKKGTYPILYSLLYDTTVEFFPTFYKLGTIECMLFSNSENYGGCTNITVNNETKKSIQFVEIERKTTTEESVQLDISYEKINDKIPRIEGIYNSLDLDNPLWEYDEETREELTNNEFHLLLGGDGIIPSGETNWAKIDYSDLPIANYLFIDAYCAYASYEEKVEGSCRVYIGDTEEAVGKGECAILLDKRGMDTDNFVATVYEDELHEAYAVPAAGYEFIKWVRWTQDEEGNWLSMDVSKKPKLRFKTNKTFTGGENYYYSAYFKESELKIFHFVVEKQDVPGGTIEIASYKTSEVTSISSITAKQGYEFYTGVLDTLYWKEIPETTYDVIKFYTDEACSIPAQCIRTYDEETGTFSYYSGIRNSYSEEYVPEYPTSGRIVPRDITEILYGSTLYIKWLDSRICPKTPVIETYAVGERVISGTCETVGATIRVIINGKKKYEGEVASDQSWRITIPTIVNKDKAVVYATKNERDSVEVTKVAVVDWKPEKPVIENFYVLDNTNILKESERNIQITFADETIPYSYMTKIWVKVENAAGTELSSSEYALSSSKSGRVRYNSVIGLGYKITTQARVYKNETLYSSSDEVIATAAIKAPDITQELTAGIPHTEGTCWYLGSDENEYPRVCAEYIPLSGGEHVSVDTKPATEVSEGGGAAWKMDDYEGKVHMGDSVEYWIEYDEDNSSEHISKTIKPTLPIAEEKYLLTEKLTDDITNIKVTWTDTTMPSNCKVRLETKIYSDDGKLKDSFWTETQKTSCTISKYSSFDLTDYMTIQASVYKYSGMEWKLYLKSDETTVTPVVHEPIITKKLSTEEPNTEGRSWYPNVTITATYYDRQGELIVSTDAVSSTEKTKKYYTWEFKDYKYGAAIGDYVEYHTTYSEECISDNVITNVFPANPTIEFYWVYEQFHEDLKNLIVTWNENTLPSGYKAVIDVQHPGVQHTEETTTAPVTYSYFEQDSLDSEAYAQVTVYKNVGTEETPEWELYEETEQVKQPIQLHPLEIVSAPDILPSKTGGEGYIWYKNYSDLNLYVTKTVYNTAGVVVSKETLYPETTISSEKGYRCELSPHPLNTQYGYYAEYKVTIQNSSGSFSTSSTTIEEILPSAPVFEECSCLPTKFSGITNIETTWKNRLTGSEKARIFITTYNASEELQDILVSDIFTASTSGSTVTFTNSSLLKLDYKVYAQVTVYKDDQVYMESAITEGEVAVKSPIIDTIEYSGGTLNITGRSVYELNSQEDQYVDLQVYYTTGVYIAGSFLSATTLTASGYTWEVSIATSASEGYITTQTVLDDSHKSNIIKTEFKV